MFSRRYAVSAVAVAVFTAGMALAVVESHPAAASTVQLAPDRSLTPGAGRPAIVSPEVAVRTGASDIPRVHPLFAPERDAVHTA